DISKALEVNVEFDLSRQLWSHLVKTGAIRTPESFIHPVPHMSFVQGADHVAFLKKRHAALTGHHLYRGMEYTEDRHQLGEWIPRPATEIRDSGGAWLRRFPGERRLDAHRQARPGGATRRQGVWAGVSRISADVGATPRHPHHRRAAPPAVRSLRRVLDEVPEARFPHRHVPFDTARQHRTDAVGRARRLRPHRVPDRPAARLEGEAIRGAARILPEGGR